MASYMEGYLEIEKGDWNVSIGFGNMGVAGEHCKSRFIGVAGAEARWE